MTRPLEYSGTVCDGRLPQAVGQKITVILRQFEGKRVTVSIREAVRSRSGQQNRYYWGVVVQGITEVFREAGNAVDAEDVHNYLKEHVGKLKQVLVTPDGEVLRSLGSTTKLSKQEFEVYLERVRAWAAETLSLELPLPNEQH